MDNVFRSKGHSTLELNGRYHLKTKTLKIETVCSGGGGGVGEARVLSPVNLAGENMNETDVPEVIPYLTLCKDKEVCGL